YYPPYHSKYNPIERCWGILELHWNGTKLVDVETMVAWARSMTWKGIHPIVALSRKVGSVSKVEMTMFTLPVQRHSGSQTSQGRFHASGSFSKSRWSCVASV